MTGTETYTLRGYRCSHVKSDSLQRLGYRVVWLYLQPHKDQMGDVGGRDGGGKRQQEGKANIKPRIHLQQILSNRANEPSAQK